MTEVAGDAQYIDQSLEGDVLVGLGVQADLPHLGQLESGFVQSDVAYWAYTGSGTFAGKTPMRDLRAIASLYPESIHIVVRQDSAIRRVRDLVGKRVSLDEPGSGTLIDAELVLDAYGIGTDDIEAEYMKPDLAMRRMRENKLDAFFVVAGYPARAISDLARETRVRLLPIDGPEAQKLISRHQFFTRDVIPIGVYTGVRATVTVSVGAQWLVSVRQNNDLIYQITRALWSDTSRSLLDGGHSKGRSITLDSALQGISVPLHPGAKRYYDEIGLETD